MEKAKQIKDAFDFIQNIYQEVASLIRKIESQLSESKYKFQLFSNGHVICSRTSVGLMPEAVNSWLRKKFAVGFIENLDNDKLQNEQVNNEKLNEKILYFKFILDDISQSEPQLIFGVLYDIEFYKDWVKKHGNLLVAIEYVDKKLLSKFPDIDYEDDTFKLKGKLKKVNLLDINSNTDMTEILINPIIKLYEQDEYNNHEIR